MIWYSTFSEITGLRLKSSKKNTETYHLKRKFWSIYFSISILTIYKHIFLVPWSFDDVNPNKMALMLCGRIPSEEK